MSKLLLCLIALWLAPRLLAATNTPVAATAVPTARTLDTNNPVERELQKLMAQDDEAQTEVDKWIQDNEKFAAEGAGVSRDDLNARIRKRFAPVRSGYERFIQQHTNHVRALVAYASFLGDLREEEAQFQLLERARALAPNDPAIWNNLAAYYGHNGAAPKAFEYYAKAIELAPNEPLYYHSFGTLVFLFRVDAMEHFKITEQQVFDKALNLYEHALKLDPENFPLATDLAMTYYGVHPRRPDAALGAWTNALRLAQDEVAREGVYVHFARVKISAGRFAEARAQLNTITNEAYASLKKSLTRTLDEKEVAAKKPGAEPEQKKEAPKSKPQTPNTKEPSNP